MTPLVKHLCKMRNRQIRMGISPELQEKINILIRENQIRAVKDENRKFKRGSKEWLRTVHKIFPGRSINVDRVSSVIDPGRMNEFFQKINTDAHYTTPVPLLIPEGTRIPTVDENNVKNMINLKRTGAGPDGFPYWLWKEYSSTHSDIEFLIGTAVCPYPLEISQPCPDSKRTAFV